MMKIINLLWYNAESRYDDWGLTGWGWMVLVIIVITIIIFFCISHSKWSKINDEEEEKKIRMLGYKDIDDIQVFLNRIDADRTDFIHSKGLRKQYELFAEGKSSEFIKTAESNKKSDEAESSGFNTGLATGVAVGSIINNQ